MDKMTVFQPAKMRFLSNRKNVSWMIPQQKYFGLFIAPHTVKKHGGLSHLSLWREWGADNGAWSGFDPDSFLEMLDLGRPYRHSCKFVALPDTPAANWKGDDPLEPMRQTFELAKKWLPIVKEYGFPTALCLHPGATIQNIEWDRIDAIFVGGTDQWRYGGKPKFESVQSEVSRIIAYAKKRGKHVHIGRMANSKIQIRIAGAWGADTVDGTCEIFENAFRSWILSELRTVNGENGIQLRMFS